jgi:hypothetical protein
VLVVMDLHLGINPATRGWWCVLGQGGRQTAFWGHRHTCVPVGQLADKAAGQAWQPHGHVYRATLSPPRRQHLRVGRRAGHPRPRRPAHGAHAQGPAGVQWQRPLVHCTLLRFGQDVKPAPQPLLVAQPRCPCRVCTHAWSMVVHCCAACLWCTGDCRKPCAPSRASVAPDCVLERARKGRGDLQENRQGLDP